MHIDQVATVGVVGCGTMGSGIAIVVAGAGYRAVVREVAEEAVDRGRELVEKFLQGGVKRGKTSPEQTEALVSRIHFTTDMNALSDCQIVIEAVNEDPDLKAEVFASLNRVCPEETIFVSNTSSLSITAMARRSGRPERVVGMHFCNPAPLMRLVEVARGLQTSASTFELVWEFAKKIGKEPVAAEDSPGFIVDRLFVPFLMNAVRVYQEGLASKEDIDKACVLGLGHPMGPLRALDMFGLDLFLPICRSLYEEYKDPQFAVPPLLKRMVEAGLCGFKSGEGFYKYDKDQLSVY